MISDKRLEQAMRYLAETDEPCAVKKAAVERSEILRKRARARVFLTSEGTAGERNAQAEVHEDVIAADHDYIDGLAEYETMKSKRQTEALVVEVWRSLSANRRAAA